MDTIFDHRAINHMVISISHEMNPSARKLRAECDTLFIGGPPPGEDDQVELAQFGLRKNWKIIYPSFAMSDVQRGPISFHAVVTDGLTETMIIQDGRLWKNDRRSSAILVFTQLDIAISVSSKGRLLIRPMNRIYHDHGYDLALEAVTDRAAKEPGHIPVLSSIGKLPAVLDIRTMNQVFANAK